MGVLVYKLVILHYGDYTASGVYETQAEAEKAAVDWAIQNRHVTRRAKSFQAVQRKLKHIDFCIEETVIGASAE